MPKAHLPSVVELREIGRRLCARIGVLPYGPIDAVALRRVFDERAHKTDAPGIMMALRACADALADYELPPEVHALRAALDAYRTARRPKELDAAKRGLAAALEKALPVLDEEADRRAKRCEDVVTKEEREAGLRGYIWPSPDSLRKFPRKMIEILEIESTSSGGSASDSIALEPYVMGYLHRIVRELALIDAHQNVRPNFASPRVRMAKALYDDGYTPAQIASIIHPFAKGKAWTAARVAIAKRQDLRSDEVEVHIPRRGNPADAEALARAEGQYVLTGRIDGMRTHLTAPPETIKSIVARELPVEDRLRPKRPRRDQGKSAPKTR